VVGASASKAFKKGWPAIPQINHIFPPFLIDFFIQPQIYWNKPFTLKKFQSMGGE